MVVVEVVEAAVEVSEAAGGEEETDPSFLQKSLMPSWMPIMLRYVIRLHEISFINYLDNTEFSNLFLLLFFLNLS